MIAGEKEMQKAGHQLQPAWRQLGQQQLTSEMSWNSKPKYTGLKTKRACRRAVKANMQPKKNPEGAQPIRVQKVSASLPQYRSMV